MREGAAAGITTPRVVVERALEQLEALMPEDVTMSTLWKPMMQFPASMKDDARKSIEADYRRILVEETIPALRHLGAFVRNFYLPKARTTDGFGALPNGKDMYRLAVRYETTTDRTPDEIHEVGLTEVKRIQASYLLITHQGPPRCGLTNLAISAVFQRDGHGTQSHPIPEGSF